MFVFLSKFLPQFVYPTGLVFLLLMLACLVRRRPRLRTGLIIAAAMLLFVAGSRVTAYSLARSLEWRYLPLENIPRADVIVVLGGATEPLDPPRPSVEVNAAGDRVLYAVKLYREGVAPRLLLSGGVLNWNRGRATTPAEDMAALMRQLGVPQEALWEQPRSQNTAEDALYSAQMLKEAGIERVVLVTSAMHMPRSVALFRKQGIEVIPAPTDFTVTQQGWDRLFQPGVEELLTGLLPSSSSLNLTTNALKEYIGMLAYRVQGYID